MISERVLEALEWDRIVELLTGGCRTAPGRDFARTLEPLTRLHAASRLGKLTDLKKIKLLENDSPDFSGIEDIGQLAGLAEKGGVLTLEELGLLRNFLTACAGLRRFLVRHRDVYPAIASEADGLDPLNDLTSLFSKSLTEAGALSRGAYPELGKIEDEIAALRRDMEKRLTEIIHSPAMSACLQEKMFTTRGDRYVLLLKSTFRGKIKGTVHDISSSEATLFIEPDAVTDLNNRIVMKEHALRREISRILAALSAQAGEKSSELQSNLIIAGRLDFLNSGAELSEKLNAVEPLLSEEAVIDLYNARHPLLYLMNPGGTVPNSVSLGKNFRCLLITGANTGGKTVLLKTIGLCALMAKHGLHIPAGPDSVIAVFDGIFADIGDDQNLSQSLSTFSGQIVALNEMLVNALPNSLVLIDEIVVGTNPRQGAALARAILESLADTGALMAVTTHYSELKNLATTDPRFENASVSFDPDSFAPTYRLLTGLPGSSHAVEIAGLYGLSRAVLARARSLIDESELAADGLIEKVQRLEEDLRGERELIADLRKELEREKGYLAGERRKLQSLEAELKAARGVEFLDEIERLKREISERARELRGADMRTLGELRRDIDSMETSVREGVKAAGKQRLSDSHRPFDPESCRPGDAVMVLPLGKRCVIESIDTAQGTAQVLLGNSLRSRFPFEELMIPVDSGKKKRKPKETPINLSPPGESFVPLTIQTSYNTIDLRGRRVDEALSEMHAGLDAMVRSGVGCAVIIHGHGTGAVKEAVRSELKHSSYVNDFRPGEQGEGGDGVTIAVLRR